MKPVLYLDPEMPKTHMVPADESLYNKYLDLCYDYQFADPEYPEREEKALKAIRDFQAMHPFKEVPLIKQQKLLLGRGAAMRGYGRMRSEPPFQRAETTEERKPPEQSVPEKSYVTHPDNVATLTPEQKEGLDIRPMKTTAEYMKEWGISP